MDAPRFYSPPGSALNDPLPTDEAKIFALGPLQLGWIAVFLFNLTFPLLFGWRLGGSNGRIGMFAAILILLAAGYWICSARRELGRLLVIGGAFVGLAQIYPILQIVAGLGGMVVGQALGQVGPDDLAPPTPLTQVGGFIVTLTTGALLMLASTALGYAAQRIRPWRWWRNRERSD